MEINIELEEKIKEVFDKSISEGVSGRLFCTNAGLIKIAKLIGLDYTIMGKEKRAMFRMDVISGYQMGFFKKHGDY